MAQSCDRIVRGLRERGVIVDVLHFMPAPARAAVGDRAPGGRALPRLPDRGRSRRTRSTAPGARWRPGRKPITHVVAFGGSRPIMAAPVFAAWLGVPLITLIRGNDFDAAVFSTRRRPIARRRADAQRAGVRRLARQGRARSRRCTRASRCAGSPTGSTSPTGRSRRATSSTRAAWRAQRRRPPRARAVRPAEGQEGRRLPARRAAALRRRRTRFHLLLAGWMEPDMEAWLADARDRRTPRSRSWIASSCCRGTRRATGSRSRPSTTGCRTCSSRPRRSASRWSPRAPAAWPTCSTDAHRAALRSRRRGPLRVGAAAAPRDARRGPAPRDGRRLPRARRRPSSTASSRLTRYVRGAAPTRGSRSRAGVILYYALGGGLGHLTRARKVIAALGLRDVALLTASRHARRPARDRRAARSSPSRRRSAATAPRFRRLAAQHAGADSDELIVDSFPGGILGELCELELPPSAARRPAAALGDLQPSGSTARCPSSTRCTHSNRSADPPGPVEPLALPHAAPGRAAARRAALARRPLRPAA